MQKFFAIQIQLPRSLRYHLEVIRYAKSFQLVRSRMRAVRVSRRRLEHCAAFALSSFFVCRLVSDNVVSRSVLKRQLACVQRLRCAELLPRVFEHIHGVL